MNGDRRDRRLQELDLAAVPSRPFVSFSSSALPWCVPCVLNSVHYFANDPRADFFHPRETGISVRCDPTPPADGLVRFGAAQACRPGRPLISPPRNLPIPAYHLAAHRRRRDEFLTGNAFYPLVPIAPKHQGDSVWPTLMSRHCRSRGSAPSWPVLNGRFCAILHVGGRTDLSRKYSYTLRFFCPFCSAGDVFSNNSPELLPLRPYPRFCGPASRSTLASFPYLRLSVSDIRPEGPSLFAKP